MADWTWSGSVAVLFAGLAFAVGICPYFFLTKTGAALTIKDRKEGSP
ncbi:hypothetical protein H0178_30875 [Cytobacillus firmus]|nr:hypothetical protein [Cytobacillus firmus]